MKAIRLIKHLLGHVPSGRELARLRILDDSEFDAVKTKHLAKRQRSATPDTAGIIFFISVIGAPTFLVLGLIRGDQSLWVSSIFWLIVCCLSFIYLAFSAQYWREHQSIISEDIRRHGRPSFG